MKACGTDQDWKYFNALCFKYFTQALSWSNARSHCKTLNGSLVTLDTAEKHKFVTSNVLPAAYGRVWIGLSRNPDEPLVWKWEDGSLLSFDQWDNGEPNNNDGDEYCVHMAKGEYHNSQWNNGWLDIGCSYPDGAPYICERRANVETEPY